MAIYGVLAEFGPEFAVYNDIGPAFADYGFNMKLKTSRHLKDDIGPVEFLKGWWLKSVTPDTPYYIWTPLPSRLIKLTKTLRNPVELVAKGTPARMAMRHVLATLGWMMTFAAQAPPLAAVYHHWANLSEVSRSVCKWYDEAHPYSVGLNAGKKATLSEEHFYSCVLQRYGGVLEHWTAFFAQLAHTREGSLLYSHAWDALSLDYC
jgi:hypothetical protein